MPNLDYNDHGCDDDDNGGGAQQRGVGNKVHAPQMTELAVGKALPSQSEEKNSAQEIFGGGLSSGLAWENGRSVWTGFGDEQESCFSDTVLGLPPPHIP